MAKNKPKDHYKILGIAPTATEKEIKSAYRSLARKYHPDVNQGNKEYEAKFKEVTEAYSILSDDKQRYLYDLTQGFKKINPEPPKQTPPRANDKGKPEQKTKPKTKPANNNTQSKKETNFSETFSSLFENIMKSGEQHLNKPKPRFTTEPPPQKKEKNTYSDIANKNLQNRKKVKGNDITLDIYLMVNEAKNGTIRTVNILHTDPCGKCKGKGILGSTKCQYCEGKG
ncbi:MAG: J domain-containing protein, partial [Vampirovibrionia bacterium]